MLSRRLKSIFVSFAVALLASQQDPVHASDATEINLPSMGSVAGADLSSIEEREIGEKIMAHLRSDASYMQDAESTDYLNRLGYRLVAAGAGAPFDFFFFPIRDHSLNAFAMPGGFIAVHSGLIVKAHTESELAGVIGHEIGHVTQRHIARMLENSKGSWAATIGSLVLAILAARAGGSSGGDAAMAITMGTQAALLQRQLSYSRDAEREADRTGLKTLVNAGFDPRGIESFFDRLQQSNRFQESVASNYVSTHPMTSERINDMKMRTRKMPVRNHADSLDFLLIQARMRVLQETRKEALNEQIRRFSEELQHARGRRAAAVHYGLSVAHGQAGELSRALWHARKATELAGEHSVILDKNLAEKLFAAAGNAEQREQALAVAKSMTERYSFSAMASQSYAELLHQAGRHEAVVRFLRRQRALSHESVDYYGRLARSYEAMGQISLSHAATGDMYAQLGNAKAAAWQFELAQKANDGDFYVMSEIDAKLRRERRKVLEQKESK